MAVTGNGPPVVFLHGFALHPDTYRATRVRLAAQATVVTPALFRLDGRWSYERVLGLVIDGLQPFGSAQLTVIGHSFGGGLALGIAARHPGRVRRLVLVDSLGLTSRWDLARDACLDTRFLRMVSARAVRDFVGSWWHSPSTVARAGWWAFSCDKDDEVRAVREAGVATSVVWAADDSLLPVAQGRAFARRLGASFHAVAGAGRLLEHDWVYRHPDLFVATLAKLGLLARADQP